MQQLVLTVKSVLMDITDRLLMNHVKVRVCTWLSCVHGCTVYVYYNIHVCTYSLRVLCVRCVQYCLLILVL